MALFNALCLPDSKSQAELASVLDERSARLAEEAAEEEHARAPGGWT